MKGKVFVVILLACAANIAHTEPTVWYVHPDSALNSIQAALDSCADNDIVLVGPGTYYENIDWPYTQGIHLIGEMGSEATIIDGDSAGTVITCNSNTDTTTVIRGFTIRNGLGLDHGAGIFCYWITSAITIENNLIINNHCIGDHGMGGGILCGHAIIRGNTVSSNSVHEMLGGGICCVVNAFGNAIIVNNTIIGNQNGGICCGYGSSPTIDSCSISNNSECGILCLDGSTPEIHYCNIVDNAGYGILKEDSIIANAEDNWWGDATGPYHPDSNPGGLGDTVSDYVDFRPWLTEPVGVKEKEVVEVERRESRATIFAGPLRLPEGKKCRVFDITGRVVAPDKIRPGIYFIEVDGQIAKKFVKIK